MSGGDKQKKETAVTLQEMCLEMVASATEVEIKKIENPENRYHIPGLHLAALKVLAAACRNELEVKQ